MIHKVDGGYVISSHRIWLPGYYDSEQTARYAFKFPDKELRNLQESKILNPITMDDLRVLRKSIKKATSS